MSFPRVKCYSNGTHVSAGRAINCNMYSPRDGDKLPSCLNCKYTSPSVTNGPSDDTDSIFKL